MGGMGRMRNCEPMGRMSERRGSITHKSGVFGGRGDPSIQAGMKGGFLLLEAVMWKAEPTMAGG